MSRIIYRQLIGHEDFSLGQGKISQERGDRTVNIRQIELEFIFRTVAEIKEIDYSRYAHVALHTVGPVIQYYFDGTSMATPDDILIIKPDLLLVSQAGRYIRFGIYDTIIASCSDEETPLATGGPKTTFRAPYAMNLVVGYIRASLTNAPMGQDLIIDIKMNGSTMFSSLLTIDANNNTSVGSSSPAVLSITAVPDDAEFTVYVDQVGSSYAGSGLKVAITGIKTT